MKTDNPSPIRFPEGRARSIVVGVTFMVALVIAAIMIGKDYLAPIMLLFFPTGFLFLLPEAMANRFFPADDPGGGFSLAMLMGYGFLGWVLYARLASVIVRSTKRRTAIVLYVLLILLLVANLAGCSKSFIV